ncbi:hypothetical protein B0H67DRAFT_571093 [Lasiosphaeris hirsuta]|uniref:Uncharacterized protein n=1 Tax=Lasiosphaeris hirsuta TaxID=260670 RepID=A0AA40E6D3_9PEZI|nr:hypothetical protein B0H67DRAFT_571093 [Lasiosphaeris hirsuta]
MTSSPPRRTQPRPTCCCYRPTAPLVHCRLDSRRSQCRRPPGPLSTVMAVRAKERNMPLNWAQFVHYGPQ